MNLVGRHFLKKNGESMRQRIIRVKYKPLPSERLPARQHGGSAAQMFGLFDKTPFFCCALSDSTFSRVLKENYPVGIYSWPSKGKSPGRALAQTIRLVKLILRSGQGSRNRKADSEYGQDREG